MTILGLIFDITLSLFTVGGVRLGFNDYLIAAELFSLPAPAGKGK